MSKREGETYQHQKAKADIADACLQAGYSITIEAAGDGWRADVLAAPPNGAKGRIAFEVQWSPLTLEECLERQRRYAQDDIRGCWFFRQPPPALVVRIDSTTMLKARRELPLFHLWINADRSFAVSLNGTLYPLNTFVAALLRREIRFCEHITAQAEQTVQGAFLSISCPRCGSMTAIYHVQPRLRSRCGIAFTPDESWLSPEFAFHPRVIAAARAFAAEQHIRLGELKRCETGEFTFHCARCAQPISHAALNIALYGSTTLSQAYVTDSFMTEVSYAYCPKTMVAHWCFPHNRVFCV